MDFTGAQDPEKTRTTKDQVKTEQDVVGHFKRFLLATGVNFEPITLDTHLHVPWLLGALRDLPSCFSGLDASRPWFVYWISHTLDVLGSFDTDFWAPKVGSFIEHCAHPGGGFAGGPMQLSHLAPTYAAIAAIITAGDERAYRVVDRAKVYSFLMSMKVPEGGFRMHALGEIDMRGTYCALAVASMLHIITDELTTGVAAYVRGCQTYEGGLAGECGLEAHGGYTYCGLAALCIIGEASVLNLHALLNWVAHRQMAVEGGFQGRTNKLVDSCYSFWQGAVFPLVHEALRQSGQMGLPDSHVWFSPTPLQMYVLLACQHKMGGLRDKPGKSADYYHSCYSLSGVAIAQHGLTGPCSIDGTEVLRRVDIFYNVNLSKSEHAASYFCDLPFELEGTVIAGCEGKGAVQGRAQFLENYPLDETVSAPVDVD